MVKIRWLISAKEDLKEIFDFIAIDSKQYARFQVYKIKKKVALLKTHSKAGKTVQEFQENEIRELICDRYRVFYKIINKDLIHILMIHHGARKFPRDT